MLNLKTKDNMKQIVSNTHEPKCTIFGVISSFYYRFKIWQVDTKYAELDMNMQCTTMSYKEYKEDADDLSKQRDYWEEKLNGL